uniref:Uncharacterized protein n=1 Tax=Glossina pallidipes TaxID=7398 RepID=A0A1B0AEJ2_GLOPL
MQLLSESRLRSQNFVLKNKLGSKFFPFPHRQAKLIYKTSMIVCLICWMLLAHMNVEMELECYRGRESAYIKFVMEILIGVNMSNKIVIALSFVADMLDRRVLKTVHAGKMLNYS